MFFVDRGLAGNWYVWISLAPVATMVSLTEFFLLTIWQIIFVWTPNLKKRGQTSRALQNFDKIRVLFLENQSDSLFFLCIDAA